MSNSEAVRSGSAVPSMSIAIDSPGTSGTLSESPSLRAVVLCESAAMSVVGLFDSSMASTVILPGAPNPNMVSSGVPELRAASLLAPRPGVVVYYPTPQAGRPPTFQRQSRLVRPWARLRRPPRPHPHGTDRPLWCCLVQPPSQQVSR